MQITHNGRNVYVTLSERNLKHLQEALSRGDTAGLVRQCEDGTNLHIRAEADSEHYQNREPGPGITWLLSQHGD